MGEQTLIEWTDHTFNPWVGCTKVSPACDHCYAESWAKRTGGAALWAGERRRTAAANWKQPLRWNKASAGRLSAWQHGIESVAKGDEAYLLEAGFIKPRRARVFCASLADWMDNQVPIGWLVDLLDLIRVTPALDWQLLTKRPQNILKRLVEAHTAALLYRKVELECWLMDWVRGAAPRNVWLGTTVENQAEADRRIPHLLAVPARARFLSCEPLLGPVDLTVVRQTVAPGFFGDCLQWHHQGHCHELEGIRYPTIDWVIAGGETTSNARPMHPDWARGLRDQCAAADVPFFFKQWGEWAPHKPQPGGDLGGDVRAGRVQIVHPTGQSEVEVFEATGRNTIRGSHYMVRIGRDAAGAMLDGREHREFPL